MKETVCRVDLLASTPNALALIYASFRQCYHSGFVADLWPKLLSGEIPAERQAEFVHGFINSGHESPIEHVSFTFAVEGVSRALTHQLVRHRLASYSQQSQRYTSGADFSFVLPPQIAAVPEARELFQAHMQNAAETYRRLQSLLAEHGINEAASREDARFVLPQAAATRIVITMNCRALLHFFELRLCTRAQWEIRRLARLMLEHCRKELPAVFRSAGPACDRLGYCPEGAKSCGRRPAKKD